MPIDHPDGISPISVSRADIKAPIDIQKQTINVAIDIVAQTLAKIQINIASSSVTLNINIAAAAAGVTLNVNVKSQTANINVNLAASGITLDINVKSQTANINVNLAASGITLDINVKSQTANINVNLAASGITLDINVKSQTANINVKIAASDVTVTVSVTGTAQVNLYAQNVGIYLKPEWEAKEGNDKNFAGTATNQAPGVELVIYYTAPTDKTLYITQVAFAVFATNAADADKPQMCTSRIHNVTGTTPLWHQGGNGGGGLSFTKPLAVPWPQQVGFYCRNGSNHNCSLFIVAGGYEI